MFSFLQLFWFVHFQKLYYHSTCLCGHLEENGACIWTRLDVAVSNATSPTRQTSWCRKGPTKSVGFLYDSRPHAARLYSHLQTLFQGQ